jgi:1,4-dihydroxy-2-naphthoate octaprenyltransferase
MLDTSRRLDRPSPALAGPGLAAGARRAFLATRPAFFVASAMPVLIGSAWAGSTFHHFNGLWFGLALAATVLAHAAANVYNDVGDDVIGADADNSGRIYPYTGGSRFIQTGLLSRRQMTRLALGLAAAALLLGALLAMSRGMGVVLLRVHSYPRAGWARLRLRSVSAYCRSWEPCGCRRASSIPERYSSACR